MKFGVHAHLHVGAASLGRPDKIHTSGEWEHTNTHTAFDSLLLLVVWFVLFLEAEVSAMPMYYTHNYQLKSAGTFRLLQ